MYCFWLTPATLATPFSGFSCIYLYLALIQVLSSYGSPGSFWDLSHRAITWLGGERPSRLVSTCSLGMSIWCTNIVAKCCFMGIINILNLYKGLWKAEIILAFPLRLVTNRLVATLFQTWVFPCPSIFCSWGREYQKSQQVIVIYYFYTDALHQAR